jgi:hypothetical protein
VGPPETPQKVRLAQLEENLDQKIEQKFERLTLDLKTAMQMNRTGMLNAASCSHILAVAPTPSTFAAQYKAYVSSKAITEVTNPPWASEATSRADKDRAKKAKRVWAKPPDRRASETKVLQPWISEAIKKWEAAFGDTVYVLHDRHDKDSFKGRSPDTVASRRGMPFAPISIALVGDTKSGDFGAEDKGHLIGFLSDLALCQPQSKHINGFLTNGTVIQFFQLQPQENGRHRLLEVAPAYLAGVGSWWLLQLLEQKRTDILEISYRGKTLNIFSYLGDGGCSVVYAARLEDSSPVVVKLYHKGAAALCETESRALMRLRRLGKLVPEVLECDAHARTLLLAPVALRFAAHIGEYAAALVPRALPTAIDEGALSNRYLAYSEHYCQLVDILAAAHQLGVIHRDLSHSNFFLRLDGSVFLNDWSCAAILPDRVLFEGALQLAPDPLLDAHSQGIEYSPSAIDDLLMLVRTVFSRVCPADYCRIGHSVDPPELKSFWRKHLALSPWPELVAVAVSRDYAALKFAIVRVVAPMSATV